MLVITCTWKSQRMGTSHLTLMLINWTWGCTTFHNFISMLKKKKKIKSWQVCDWLAKWFMMSGYMDLRRPRVYRRSNVGLVITCNSEVIIFSPGVFVWVCVVVYMCLIRCCPDDLAMKDWCHTNNILQVHSWQCLVMQVLFHTLVTSMMSPGHKVGQIFLNWYISVNISGTASIKTQNIENVHGYLTGIFNFRYLFR